MDTSYFILNPISLIKDINRFKEIISVLIKHGFGQIVIELGKGDSTIAQIINTLGLITRHDINEEIPTIPKRIRLVFQDLGPTFIKMGQILSTRSDLVPIPIADELKILQDNIPPFDFQIAKKLVEEQLNKELHEVFSEFAEKPIGTASIGQVYKAKLKCGANVVVKIQRPDVKSKIECDVELMHFISIALEKRLPFLKTFNLPGIVHEFRKAILKELDYLNELRNCQRFVSAFEGDQQIVFPKCYKEFSTQKILTMELIDGIKVTDAEKMGLEKRTLAKIALRAVFKMVFEIGFFHADPHPGNIFALAGNRIAFLDLGMVGRLDEDMRSQMADLLMSLIRHDSGNVTNTLLTMGITKGKINRMQFRNEIGELVDRIVGVPLQDIQISDILRSLMEICRENNLKIPNEYTLLGKALLTTEIVGKNLDPDLNIEEELKPFVEKLVVGRFSPKQIVQGFLKKFSSINQWTDEFQGLLIGVLEDLESGNVKIKIEQPDQFKALKDLERIVKKLIAGIILASLIMSSAILLSFTKDVLFFWGTSANLFLGIGGYIVAVVLAISLIRSAVKTPSD